MIMNIKQILKPSNLTSLGLILIALPMIIDMSNIIQKIGAGLVIIGTLLFFIKK